MACRLGCVEASHARRISLGVGAGSQQSKSSHSGCSSLASKCLTGAGIGTVFRTSRPKADRLQWLAGGGQAPLQDQISWWGRCTSLVMLFDGSRVRSSGSCTRRALPNPQPRRMRCCSIWNAGPSWTRTSRATGRSPHSVMCTCVSATHGPLRRGSSWAKGNAVALPQPVRYVLVFRVEGAALVLHTGPRSVHTLGLQRGISLTTTLCCTRIILAPEGCCRDCLEIEIIWLSRLPFRLIISGSRSRRIGYIRVPSADRLLSGLGHRLPRHSSTSSNSSAERLLQAGISISTPPEKRWPRKQMHAVPHTHQSSQQRTFVLFVCVCVCAFLVFPKR